MPGVNRDLNLFEVSAKVPDGFIYRQNFISEDEEQELIHEIQKLHLKPFQYYQFTGKRRTTSFGWQYEFGASEITTAPEVPAFLLPVRTRAGKLFDIDPNSLSQTSIIEYSTGSRLAGTGIFHILALWSAFLLVQRAGCGFENITASDRRTCIVMKHYRSNYNRAPFI
jgi:hypothetical protein